MKSAVLFFPALFTTLVSGQTLLSSNLPPCAQQCPLLTQAQTSCVPSGGAPVSNQATYQSCFCQSALLSQLRGSQPVQLCSQCTQADMAQIQTWYQGLCQPGAAPVANNNQPSNTPANTPTTTTSRTTGPTAGSANRGDSDSSQEDQERPWYVPWSLNCRTTVSSRSKLIFLPFRIETHYKWVIMLIVLFIGLAVVAWVFWFLHRRYHRRREAQWSQAVGSHPDINTWGPGQSVHDLGYTPGASANIEKGKGKEQIRGVDEPPPARMRENRLSKL